MTPKQVLEKHEDKLLDLWNDGYASCHEALRKLDAANDRRDMLTLHENIRGHIKALTEQIGKLDPADPLRADLHQKLSRNYRMLSLVMSASGLNLDRDRTLLSLFVAGDEMGNAAPRA